MSGDVRRADTSRGLWQRFRQSEAFTAYAFLALPVLYLAVIRFYPILYNFYLSFAKYELIDPPQFIGLDNYLWIADNEPARRSILNTVLFTIGAVPLGTLIGLIIAVLLNNPFVRGRIVFRTLFYLPVITSVIVASMVWLLIFNPQTGLLNGFLTEIGLSPQGWLRDPQLAMPSVIMVMIWSAVGTNMIIFLAGLQEIPQEIYEASRLDGANGIQTFLHVIVPMLRPVVLFVVVTFSIAVFRSFGEIFVLTQGGPQLSTTTLVWEVYQNGFGYLQFGRAAAISMVLLMIILLITFINFRVLEERES